MIFAANFADALDRILSAGAGWLDQTLVLPFLYATGMMRWEELSFDWCLVCLYGVVQVVLTFAVCWPLEALFPLERGQDHKAVFVDVVYTLVSRVGIVPIVSFVLFYQAQVIFAGAIVDAGYTPPMLETIIPPLFGHPVLTFACYALILDFADYWRHRISHMFHTLYTVHAVHHAQRHMSFWSDDRNHLLDDVVGQLWFFAVALLIGVPPLQFPLLLLGLRFVESLSHINAPVQFGWLGERLLISPRFHRLHHGVLAAGRKSCNYGAVFPVLGHDLPHRRLLRRTAAHRR